MELLIERDTGYNFGNLPIEIFSKCSSVLPSALETGPTVITFNSEYFNFICNLLEATCRNTGINTQVITNVAGQLYTFQTIIQTPTQTNPHEEHPVDEEGDILEETDETPEDEISHNTSFFRNVKESGSILFGADLILPIEREKYEAILASKLNNDLAGRARILSDKLGLFSRKWNELCVLQGEINELRAPIAGNPVISRILNTIDSLNNNDQNLVEKIFISADGNYIIIRTKELTTTEKIEGYRRIIGHMEISVSMNNFFLKPSQNVYPIRIRNLDREYIINESDADGFQCGHVRLNGEVCMGNAAEMIFNACKSQDLETLVEILIRFIRQPDPDDCWGQHLKYWPEVNNAA